MAEVEAPTVNGCLSGERAVTALFACTLNVLLVSDAQKLSHKNVRYKISIRVLGVWIYGQRGHLERASGTVGARF